MGNFQQLWWKRIKSLIIGPLFVESALTALCPLWDILVIFHHAPMHIRSSCLSAFDPCYFPLHRGKTWNYWMSLNALKDHTCVRWCVLNICWCPTVLWQRQPSPVAPQHIRRDWWIPCIVCWWKWHTVWAQIIFCQGMSASSSLQCYLIQFTEEQEAEGG